MKKVFKDTFVGKLIAGENAAGRVLHGFVDILPLPPILNVARSVLRKGEAETAGELVTHTFQKMDKVRLTASVVVGAFVLVKLGILQPSDARFIIISIFEFFTGTSVPQTPGVGS